MASKKVLKPAAANTALADLEAKLQQVTLERDQNLGTAQEALRIANVFNDQLALISQAAQINLPEKPGFLRTIFWVLSNFNSIVAFIKAVLEQVNLWKEEITNLQNRRREQPNG